MGNKSDLDSKISTEEAQAKAEKYGFGYIETSAKSAFQVELAFTTISHHLIMKRQQINARPLLEPRIHLTSEELINKENACC